MDSTITAAPPPPSEVKIRTMRSDVESMAQSGGGLPQFHNVKISGLSVSQEPTATVARTASKNNLLAIMMAIVALLAFVVLGWLAYTRFCINDDACSFGGGNSPSQTPPASTGNTPQTQSNQIIVPTTPPNTQGNAPTSTVPIIKLGQ